MADSVGEEDVRRIYIDEAVKAVALAEYKLKTLCTISSTNAWTNKYYRETNTELTGGTGSAVTGVPRFAPFPYGEVTESLVTGTIQKFGMEGKMAEEDILTDALPMLSRTILRIGRAIAYAIDVAIEAALAANVTNTVTIAAGFEWDSATIANRDPVKDILDAIQEIRADNFNALNGNGYLVVNGTDYTNIISNSKIINHPTFKTVSAVENGVVGELCGLRIMVTEAITAEKAYVVIAMEAITFKQAQALQVEQIKNPGISTTVRAWEYGQIQVTTPNAYCQIDNTRA